MVKEVNSDYLLWKRLKSGETSAFNELYKQFADKLFSFGLIYTKDRETIKDCIHDLFFELYKYRKNLTDTDNIKNYLFRSLKRKIQTAKTKKLDIVYSAAINDSDIEKDEIHFSEEENEKVKKLRAEIDKLPERQKEALVLRFQAELSYEDIANMMEISVESVRTLVYRSVKTLRLNLSSGGKKKSITLFFAKLLRTKLLALKN